MQKTALLLSEHLYTTQICVHFLRGFLNSITVTSKKHIVSLFYTSDKEVSEDNLLVHSLILLYPLKTVPKLNINQVTEKIFSGCF